MIRNEVKHGGYWAVDTNLPDNQPRVIIQTGDEDEQVRISLEEDEVIILIVQLTRRLAQIRRWKANYNKDKVDNMTLSEYMKSILGDLF